MVKKRRKHKRSQTGTILDQYGEYLKALYKRDKVPYKARRPLISHWKLAMWNFMEIFLKRNGWKIVPEEKKDA